MEREKQFLFWSHPLFFFGFFRVENLIAEPFARDGKSISFFLFLGKMKEEENENRKLGHIYGSSSFRRIFSKENVWIIAAVFCGWPSQNWRHDDDDDFSFIFLPLKKEKVVLKLAHNFPPFSS